MRCCSTPPSIVPGMDWVRDFRAYRPQNTTTRDARTSQVLEASMTMSKDMHGKILNLKEDHSSMSLSLESKMRRMSGVDIDRVRMSQFCRLSKITWQRKAKQQIYQQMSLNLMSTRICSTRLTQPLLLSPEPPKLKKFWKSINSMWRGCPINFYRARPSKLRP